MAFCMVRSLVCWATGLHLPGHALKTDIRDELPEPRALTRDRLTGRCVSFDAWRVECEMATVTGVNLGLFGYLLE